MTGRHSRWCLLATLALAACEHSVPFPTEPQQGTTPFDQAVPTRLTYGVVGTPFGIMNGRQTRPSYSQDGKFLVYSFDDEADFTIDGMNRDHDHDVCLGVLPATGGQRRASICHLLPDSTFLRDGIEHGALAANGTLAFVRHAGVASSGSSTSGWLYLAPVDSLAGARRVFQLKRRPPGALDRWDYLLNPTWDPQARFVALATRADLVVLAAGSPPNTVYSGVEVVRFIFGPAGTTWERLAPAEGAEMLAWDAAAGRGWFLRQGSVFDALTGERVYTPPRDAEAAAQEISGLATGGGEVFVTERALRGTSTNTARLDTRIARIVSIDSAETVFAKTTLGDARVSWTRLAVSPDGQRFAFEQVGAGAWALYTYSLPT